jgi:hypothetical protein
MMKTIFVLLLSLNAHAANWVNVEGYRSGSLAAYSEEKNCPKPCVNLGDDGPFEIYAVTESLVDDETKPIFEESQVTQCESEESCEALVKTLCAQDEQGHIRANAEVFEAYCNKRVGFEKKSVYALEIDQAKKAAQETKLAEENAKKAAREAAALRVKNADFSKVTTINSLKALFQDYLVAEGK